MAKFKAYVKVPADSSGKLKRIVTKTVEASNPTDALASLRGQYGTKNVNIASKVMPGYKPRPRMSSGSRSTYVPRTPSYVKKKYSYKYAKPVSKSSGDGGGGAIAIGIVIAIYFLLKIFNLITLELMFTIFGRGKVHYWAIHNKHALAFSLSSINMMMLYLLFEGILIYFY